MDKRKIGAAVAGLATCGLLFAACNSNANSADSKQANKQLRIFQETQPAPAFEWSQLRQNLIEVETAEAHTTPTTSFMFNLGIADPVQTCPSVGFPIPQDWEITNPQTRVHGHDSVVGQLDPTGVFNTGNSTGTHVICVNAAGKPYDFYWEGYVGTVTGSVAWNYTQHHMDAVDNPTAQFSNGHI